MKEDINVPFEFEDWKEKYRIVLCLKETEDKRTWLLEERGSLERCILKEGWGQQTAFLQAEYELLQKMALTEKSIRPRVMDYRSEGEHGYLLREYMWGTTLREMVEREGVMSPRMAVEFLIQLCRRLIPFHHQKQPVIHRDIKPENVVVTTMGRVYLIDFETARSYKSDSQEDTVCMGTRGYAAPEQFGFGQTDARSDIYGIGKVLLYMVTGGCGEEDLRLLKTGREKQLKKIILRCCAYDPDKRYQTLEQLQKALSRFLKSSESRVKRGVTAAALAGIAAGVLFGFLLGNDRPGQQDISEPSAGELSEAEEISYEDLGSGWNSWNPYLYEEDVRTIILKCQEKDEAGVARACEELVEKLSKEECVIQTEPIDTSGMTEEEEAVYNQGRLGYEHVADNLAYGDGQLIRLLGSYEQHGKEITKAIRTSIEYYHLNDEGEEELSTLGLYVRKGDRSNMDGCILNILSSLNQLLSR